jgi:hypothetical protein
MSWFRCLGAWLVTAIWLLPQASAAHGIVGARFFPATITTDDPFAADEMALPTITSFAHETDYDFDYAKSILPGFAVSVGIGHVDATPQGESHMSGFSNLEITPVVELFRSPEHEAIITAGFSWEIGGSGSKSTADRFSTYTPEILGVAHLTLPCGTRLTLTYGSRSVTVTVIDRGPYIAGRAIDLSNATRLALACTDLCTLRMQILR